MVDWPNGQTPHDMAGVGKTSGGYVLVCLHYSTTSLVIGSGSKLLDVLGATRSNHLVFVCTVHKVHSPPEYFGVLVCSILHIASHLPD